MFIPPPPRILTRGGILLLVTLFALLVTVPALADIKELTTDEYGVTNSDWNTASCLTVRKASTLGVRFVHNDFLIRSPNSSNNETFAGDIYLGYDYDVEKDVFTISETSGTLALKNSAASKTITIGNLYMAKGTVLAWGSEKPTLAGNIHVASSEATINSQDAATFNITSSIDKNTSDAVLNLIPYDKNGSKGVIRIQGTSNINCPLKLTKGTIVFDGSNSFGSDFRLTLQDGTTAILSANFIGVADTSIVINGSVQYGHWQNTSANKVNYSDLIVPAGSTLTAYNKYNEGAKGSMVFGGDLQGAGALVVDTVGSTNTNSLTLGHPENSFTGTVSVNSGKLQFTVLGFDDVTYTGTNALINAASVAVASGATIDVGTTEQTLNNLSGAGTITVSQDGFLTLNNTELSKFSGSISAPEVKKTGDGTLQIYSAAENMIVADSFVVSSGRLDMQKYFKGALTVGEKLGPENYLTAIFSPGNSVGTLTIDGSALAEGEYAFTLNSGSTLLLEQDAAGMDSLIASSFNIDSNSILELTMGSIQPGAEYPIIVNSKEDFDGELANVDFWSGLLTPESANYWILSVRGNTVYASVDAKAVPEPSTWALLALGAAGLLFWRKKK